MKDEKHTFFSTPHSHTHTHTFFYSPHLMPSWITLIGPPDVALLSLSGRIYHVLNYSIAEDSQLQIECSCLQCFLSVRGLIKKKKTFNMCNICNALTN